MKKGDSVIPGVDVLRYRKIRKRIEISLVASKVWFVEKNKECPSVDYFMKKCFNPEFSNRKWVSLTRSEILDKVVNHKINDPDGNK